MHNKPHYVKVRKVNLTNRVEYHFNYGPFPFALLIDHKKDCTSEERPPKVLYFYDWIFKGLGLKSPGLLFITRNGFAMNAAYEVAELWRLIDPLAKVDVPSLYPRLPKD